MDKEKESSYIHEAPFTSKQFYFPRVALVLFVALTSAAIFGAIGYSLGLSSNAPQINQSAVLGVSTKSNGTKCVQINYAQWIADHKSSFGASSGNGPGGIWDVISKCVVIPQSIESDIQKDFKKPDWIYANDLAYAWSKFNPNYRYDWGCGEGCNNVSLYGIFALSNIKEKGIDLYDYKQNIKIASQIYYQNGGSKDSCTNLTPKNKFPYNGLTILGHMYATQNDEFGDRNGWAA